MPDQPADVTIEEVRARIRAAGLTIPEDRMAIVHAFVRDALRPIRAFDSRSVRTLEPAVTFDAAAEARSDGRA
jgi:hypothetical protein